MGSGQNKYAIKKPASHMEVDCDIQFTTTAELLNVAALVILQQL